MPLACELLETQIERRERVSNSDLAVAGNEVNENTARILVGKLAVVASAAALKASAPSAIAETFIQTRLVQPRGALYGASRIDTATIDALLRRVLPEA